MAIQAINAENMKILAKVTQETYNLLEIKGENDLVNRLVSS
jgi:hypothetical protein